jgi:hypothetical protein
MHLIVYSDLIRDPKLSFWLLEHNAIDFAGVKLLHRCVNSQNANPAHDVIRDIIRVKEGHNHFCIVGSVEITAVLRCAASIIIAPAVPSFQYLAGRWPPSPG